MHTQTHGVTSTHKHEHERIRWIHGKNVRIPTAAGGGGLMSMRQSLRPDWQADMEKGETRNW